MLYRNPVLRMSGEGTAESPDYRIVPENLSRRSCDTRRAFHQPTGMLEQMSDIPIFESDRSAWGIRPHFHASPAPQERMSDQQAQSMPVVDGSRGTGYTYHLEGGAMAIVFQAMLPHPMIPIMRGPQDTDQPQGHNSDGKCVPGALRRATDEARLAHNAGATLHLRRPQSCSRRPLKMENANGARKKRTHRGAPKKSTPWPTTRRCTRNHRTTCEP